MPVRPLDGKNKSLEMQNNNNVKKNKRKKWKNEQENGNEWGIQICVLRSNKFVYIFGYLYRFENVC